MPRRQRFNLDLDIYEGLLEEGHRMVAGRYLKEGPEALKDWYQKWIEGWFEPVSPHLIKLIRKKLDLCASQE